MLFFSLFFDKYFKIIGESHRLFLLIITFVLFIISIILYSCILNIANRLDNSLNCYYTLIQRLFRIRINQKKLREFFKLGDSSYYIIMNIFFIIIFLLFIICNCNESIQYRVFNPNNFLKKLIEES